MVFVSQCRHWPRPARQGAVFLARPAVRANVITPEAIGKLRHKWSAATVALSRGGTKAMDDLSREDASLKVREKLGHPIIDSDAHTSEYDPIFLEYAAQVGGQSVADRYRDNDMTFRNPVSLHASQNRDFFKGTAVQDAVAVELAKN
jgi:hypothetical protein